MLVRMSSSFHSSLSRFGYLALPKAFPTQILDLCFAFFILVSLHKHACVAALNEKSLLRFIGGGFVSRSRADSNRCGSFCRALPSHSATGPFLERENNTNKLIIKEFYHYYDLNDICEIKLKYATHWRIRNDH